jgi:hypothetical protein|tara:strand:- start:590 stop:1030 length:441 start_codon:yes stop_codon:yes gene_type:complete
MRGLRKKVKSSLEGICNARDSVRDLGIRARYFVNDHPHLTTGISLTALGVSLDHIIAHYTGGIHPMSQVQAGMSVGYRGASKRLLLTTMAVAGLATFGPELKEMAVNGIEAGINSLGAEDLAKTFLYFSCFSIGDKFKKHYRQKTR